MKLLVCDMCGTLMDYENCDNSWAELFKVMDISGSNEGLYKVWDRNPDYSYLEFTHDTIRHLISQGINLNDVNKLKRNSYVRDGARDLVEFCDKRDMEKIVITGGIGNSAEKLLSQYGFDHCYSSCYFRFTSSGELSGYDVQHCGSSKQKMKILKEHIKGDNIGIDEIIFVGNGHNDENLAKLINNSFDVGKNGISSTYTISSLSEIPDYF